MDNELNWFGKLEAVNSVTGEVVSVRFIDDYGEGEAPMKIYPGLTSGGLYSVFWFNRDGKRAWGDDSWTIRNVAEAKPEAEQPQNAPETHRQGTNGVRTGVEMVERLEALARRLAAFTGHDVTIAEKPGVSIFNLSAEARAIVRDLPEPVDPAEAIVDELMRKDCTTRDAIVTALKRGRALERGEG